MGIMVYSLFWVMQDLYHQPYGSMLWFLYIVPYKNRLGLFGHRQDIGFRVLSLVWA